ncbi:MAG: polysaccharide deacetylase family protein [Chloroflexota bacterium]
MTYRLSLLILTTSLLLAGCGGFARAAPAPTFTPLASATASPLPTSTQTAAPSPIPTLTQTFTPSPIPTATWVWQGPKAVQVPILLYHHIDVSPVNSRYYVTPEKFEEQIKLLRDWEYTTITTEMLVKAITEGASLPPRPIIITFDDANADNYANAFPIMQKYGFTGVLYIPFYYIGAPEKLTVDQIKEMTAAGWEVGSHSLTHPDVNDLDTARMRAEIVESRKKLQELLGVPALTFAYPFGANSSAAVDYVKFAGYIAGMGATGFTADQGISNLFVLQRCEIQGWEDAKTFIRFLPWRGDPAFLPTDTPTATLRPTRTPIPTYTQYPTRTPSP